VTALTSSSCNAGNSVTDQVTDHTPPIPGEDEHLKPSDFTSNQNKSSWMSTAYSSTKVVIDVVKESSDVFPPLKSVASGLAALLKHYDVRSTSLITSTILMITLASHSQ